MEPFQKAHEELMEERTDAECEETVTKHQEHTAMKPFIWQERER